jgi:glucan phosphoethanolaminetransferase (alkaline phosphatase superfamily)
MEDLIKMWQQYDQKLEKALSLNEKILSELQQQKAKKALSPAKKIKWVAVILGLIYVAILAYFEYHIWPFASIFMFISIGIHLLVCAIAVAMYIRQLVLIHEINISENVVQMQHKLARLHTSTINIVAICFLQLPVFSTWNITMKMITQTPERFWLIQMPIVLLFTLVGIWLYRNVHPKNQDKKWFKILFCGAEMGAVVRSGKFLREIETFKNVS